MGLDKNLDKKRDLRRRQTAECFTPDSLTNDILDKLEQYGPESWLPGKTFVDPACGNGNMLVCVLMRKLAKGHDPLEALKCIFGVELMKDNVLECRQRLLQAAGLVGVRDAKATVRKQIVHADALKYDFRFGD